MCELLIRTIDKIGLSPETDAQCTKRGDVIWIEEDGWQWGSGEARSAEHTIVKVPGVPVAKMTALLVSDLESDPTKAVFLRMRAFKFDLDTYAIQQQLPGAKPLDEAAALALKLAKPAVVISI